MKISKLIIATSNRHKVEEIRYVLRDLDLKIYSLLDFKKKILIKENGKTFCANAKIKAVLVSKVFMSYLVVGEDSGLCVDVLDGRPAVRSARFAGSNKDDNANNFKLMSLVRGYSLKQRRAKFVTCLALAEKGRVVSFFEGKLEGFILTKPRGKNGFGYDPLFYLPVYKKTLAQLSFKEKNKISHRYQAFRKLRRFLINI